MYVKKPNTPIAVRLPNGELLSLSDLPPRDTKRWVARRKLRIVQAILSGLVTREDMQNQYDISPEELEEWVLYGCHAGLDGLKVTRRKV
ncbi:MAG: DUF1153 domain-containing protein [Pseudomonadota bacterium]